MAPQNSVHIEFDKNPYDSIRAVIYEQMFMFSLHKRNQHGDTLLKTFL
jgi:hypothetical protein